MFRDSVLAPVFASIEEFLGRNTEAYYSLLADVGAGSWQPERDARPWIRFCLRAHYTQVRTMLRRREEIEALWNACLAIVGEKGLPERCASGVMDAAYGLRLRRRSYRTSVEAVTGDEISDLTASRDLKAMVGEGMLTAVGERRGRYYLAGDEVTALRARVRAARSPKVADDPFTVVRDRRQLSLT